MAQVMNRLWRDYGLSITLVVLFVGSWTLQTWTGWNQYVAEQAAHGEQAEAFGPNGYIWTWGEATFENWQSEFLQLFTMVVLTAFLIHKGSHESKDQDEKVDQTLARIERRLERIEQAQGSLAGANDAIKDDRHLVGAGSTTRS
jgi:hypothetical protein